MKNIRMSLIDNDYVIQAKTNLNANTVQNGELAKFFNRLQEELVIGETEVLTIEGLKNGPVNFRITATG